MACNLLGTTNTCMFIMDEPDVMDAFFKVTAEKYIEFYETVYRLDRGTLPQNGFGVNDDDCYLFPPKQYERFCAPFLNTLFQKFAPNPGDLRRQHSDSNMAHLMGILNDLGVNEVNFGPEIPAEEIRKAMPDAYIHGQIPPFLLRNGTRDEIFEAVKHDFDSVGADGGLCISLAGVVPESTPLENIRFLMEAVDTLTRYP